MALTIETPDTLHDEGDKGFCVPFEQPVDHGGSDTPEGNDGEFKPESLNDSSSSGNESANSDPPTAHEEDKFWQEIELLEETAQAERDCQNIQREFDDLTQQRKETKEELDASVLRLRQSTSRLMEFMDERGSPERPEVPDAAPDPWQDKPTADLLVGTKGLGKKKLDAIVDLAPTAGKLEELRGEASKQCKSFREILPKGCGQSIADAVEDRLIEHVARCSPNQEIADQIAEREREQIDEAISEAHQAEPGEHYEDADE